MIIEMNELKEGVLVCQKDSKGKLYVGVVPFEKLIKNLAEKVELNEKKLLNTILKADDLYKKNLPGIVDNYTAKHDRLVNFMAYEVMLDDINYNGVDYPDNFEEIKKWILEQKGEAPAGFDKYIKQVNGEVSEND